MKEFARQFDDTSRRDFLTYAARGFLGVGLAAGPLAAAPAAASRAASAAKAAAEGGTAKHVIYLFMNGGMSHIDTLDPKTDAEIAGPVRSITTKADGLRFSEYLPKLARHADQMAVLRSLHSKQGAHDRGRYFMRTSYLPRATIVHPAMGAWALRFKGTINENLPGNVLIDGGSDHPAAGFMSSQYSPLRIGDPSDGLQDAELPESVTPDQFRRRLALARHFDYTFRKRYPHEKVKAYSGFYDDAVRMMKSKDLDAFDLTKEKKEVRESYGSGRFSQGCLLARRLVEHGVRYIEVNHNGWDTHDNNFDRVPSQCGGIDQPISALLSDLKAKGLLKDTLVVLATEFGRTPEINDRQGRDHHPRAFSGFLAGGGVRGGQAYGRSDARGYAVEENPVSISDFNATIAHALGLPQDREVVSPSNRPFTVADKGKPVTAIF